MSDIHVYSGLKLLPAAVALLSVDTDLVARAAVQIRPVERRGTTSSWTEDEVTIDWERLADARRSSTALRLADLARSMLDGTPVDLQVLAHFEHGTWTHLMRSLAVAWPDAPPSIDDMLASGQWRELNPDAHLPPPGDDAPA